MIEILLDAERQLTMGLLDQAEKLYWQAIENDPQNAIAVVGLARVALERGDERTAYAFTVQALSIDPENSTAVRLEQRLAEILATRGEPIERPPHAIEAARRAEERSRAELALAAEGAPAPAPPVAIYPGDRPLGQPRPSEAPGPVAPVTPPAAAESPAPGSGAAGPEAAHARWRPGLFKRFAGRGGGRSERNGGGA
ncbi:MAG: tetratricopeptide repeat protein [Candidatus Limnocylindrales bacterium]